MRIVLILKRIFEAIIKLPYNIIQFGLYASFWISFVYVFPSKKGQKYMSFLQRFFEIHLKKLTSEYQNYIHPQKNLIKSDKIPVWICWFDGYDSMPELVKVCYNSVYKNIPEELAEIKLITINNYHEFVHLPEYIVEKFNNKKICPAHFSDILRFALLSKYGGMWLDATVYISSEIPVEYLTTDFYTQKVSDKEKYYYEPSRAQWCGFIWSGSPNNILFSFVRDGLFSYWQNFDAAIDYIFFDYIILNAYNNIANVKDMIDNQKPNNELIWDLWQSIDLPFDQEKYNYICEQNIFHKLTYKKQVKKYVGKDQLTFYGYISSED